MIENPLNWLLSSIYLMIIFSFLLIPFYFFPTLIAWGWFEKAKNNTMAIFVFNLLLGWTFIGWVISLVWAFKKDN